MYTPTFRKKRNGVPILSKNEMDIMGERLVMDFCPQAMTMPMEIDIDRFVLRYLGLKQDFQYLSHNGIYLGMTVFNDTNKVPVYNPETKKAQYISAKAGTVIIDNSLLEESKEHRYRFTMGHEGAHGFIHPSYFGYNPNQLSLFNSDYQPLVQCRVDNKNAERKPLMNWLDADWMEWQANFLSSAVLMPKSMVLKLIASLPKEEYSFLPAYYAYEVSRTFNVSIEAAEYRLRHLGIIPKDAVVEFANNAVDIFV